MAERAGAAERAAWAAGLAAGWAGGYFALGSVAPARARDLAGPLDAWIPFVPESVWPYLFGVAAIAAPAVGLRGRTRLRRTAAAYALALAASFLAFALFPVTSVGLRARGEALAEVAPLTAWALERLYALDPPYNLFPSLHVSLSWLAARALARESPRLGALGFAAAAVVAVSACTVKQHFALDVAGGVALAELANALTEGAGLER
ncbi:MAG TPA: phosphatase PAP2 family protein [Myxococcota bacterium]|nr:phosphatase PAP2 family protein [Myxococcota bacterium]